MLKADSTYCLSVKTQPFFFPFGFFLLLPVLNCKYGQRQRCTLKDDFIAMIILCSSSIYLKYCHWKQFFSSEPFWSADKILSEDRKAGDSKNKAITLPSGRCQNLLSVSAFPSRRQQRYNWGNKSGVSGRGHPGKTAEEAWKLVKKGKCYDKGRNTAFSFVMWVLPEITLYLGREWKGKKLKEWRVSKTVLKLV